MMGVRAWRLADYAHDGNVCMAEECSWRERCVMAVWRLVV